MQAQPFEGALVRGRTSLATRLDRWRTKRWQIAQCAVAAGVAASFALLVAALLPFRVADVTVAFAPGAQDTMMVLALAMHLDPVYVGAHHLARFLVVSFSVAIVARRMARQPSDKPRAGWKRSGHETFDD